MAVPYDTSKLSLSRLKRKTLLCLTNWRYFVTLTFAPEERNFLNSYDILPSYEILDGEHALVMNGRINLPTVKYFSESLEYFNYKISGKIVTTFWNRIKNCLRKLGGDPNSIRYGWKYEEGRLRCRPHFHMVVSTPICLSCFHFLVERYWKSGFVKIKPIVNDVQLLGYMHKEFTKETQFRFFQGKRRWGFSRNNIVIDLEKSDEWEYRKPLYSKADAMKINQNSYREIANSYSVDFYEKLQRNLETSFGSSQPVTAFRGRVDNTLY